MSRPVGDPCILFFAGRIRGSLPPTIVEHYHAKEERAAASGIGGSFPLNYAPLT